MYQAIVFLPLLGAILAGLIAIFGAHARNPSGDTVEHHDDAHGSEAHASEAHDDHGHPVDVDRQRSGFADGLSAANIDPLGAHDAKLRRAQNMPI